VSDNEPSGVAISGGTLIWAIVAMFAVTVAGVVGLAEILDDPTGTITALLGSFAALTAAIGTLFSVKRGQRQLQRQVEQLDQKTDTLVEQTNGGLDHRIRQIGYASMRKALKDHLEDTP
jgi:membrane protein implicated in regulation of membrane protease activity